jgi:hypothetical protein
MTHIKHIWNIHYVEVYRTFVPYMKNTLCRSMQNVCNIQGRIKEGRTRPLKLEKNNFFCLKSWFFTRNTQTIFLSAPPNLKSWIRPWHMWRIHYGEVYRTFVPYVKHTLCRSIQNVCTICEAYIMSKYTERLYHMWSIHYVEVYGTFVPYVKHTLCRSIQNVCTICEVYIMSRHTKRVYHMWSIHYVEAYKTFVPYVKYTLCRSIQNVCTICEVYIMSRHTERLYHMWSIH